MSQQSNAKPSLQGVRIKARKGAVKAQAKHEPEVFRDQLYKHLETVAPDDFDAFTNKLVSAGSTLEFLKYAEALFEIVLVGGLLQPGGSYIDDGAPISPFSIFNAPEPPKVDDIKKYIDVLNKLIRRYKYLQKPLEERSLPTLLQYLHRWAPEQKEKLCIATAVMMSQGLSTANCLQSLTKEHLIKDDISLNAITTIFRTYLLDQSMEHLSSALKRGGIKDFLAFFPANKRSVKSFDTHFRAAGLPQVADWFAKRQYAVAKDSLTRELKDMCAADDSPASIAEFIQEQQNAANLPDAELVQCIWTGLTASIDFSSRPDQVESLIVREITKFAPIIEPFSQASKTQIALINVVQVYCYEDAKVMKAFPQILKVLYNTDCVSDQAIIYWHQKASKPNGRQHFLKMTEPLVTALQEQEDESGEEE